MSNIKTDQSKLKFGYYSHFAQSSDLKDFKRRVNDAVNSLGFEDYVFMRAVVDDVNPREINTIEPDFAKLYYQEHLEDHDILLPQILYKTKQIFHSTVHEYVVQAPFDIDHSDGMKQIYELSKSFGYYDFFNTPMKSACNDGNVIFSVTGKELTPIELRKKVKGLETTLELICEAIDYVSTTKYQKYFVGKQKKVKLKDRPLEILNELANHDLTINQVAEKLSMSRGAVNNQLSTAKSAFGVNTNYAAIKKAIKLKLIHYD